jgi:hypothetical protein
MSASEGAPITRVRLNQVFSVEMAFWFNTKAIRAWKYSTIHPIDRMNCLPFVGLSKQNHCISNHGVKELLRWTIRT